MRASIAFLPLLSLAATVAAEDAVSLPKTAPRQTASGEPSSTHSWEMPALVVQGARDSSLREEDLIGSYAQPRWTARRRFTESRVYVVPEGQIEFEYWLVVKDKDDEPDEVQQIYEIEIGLPNRFQLDLYQVYVKEGARGTMGLDATKFELRYALADWGKIWGNPTLYGEWKAANADYDSAEFKLLLADEITTKWHWATNFVYERKLGGDESIAREMTNAISYTLQDERFSLGIEDKLAWEDNKDDRGNYEKEFLLGPSIQFRPLPQMHIDLSYMVGLNDESPDSKTTFIAGWEF